ncbi:uncharacterized protein N7500_000194, partial [Penicillium coprophilum]|uniref:uncharacterized protein n=1 Tax=Penicillium coprophilum TaxID=36646 RepID=UPI0023840A64
GCRNARNAAKQSGGLIGNEGQRNCQSNWRDALHAFTLPPSVECLDALMPDIAMYHIYKADTGLVFNRVLLEVPLQRTQYNFTLALKFSVTS